MITKKAFIAILGFLCAFSSLLMAEIKSGQAIQITISGVPVEEKGRFDQMYPVSASGMINMPIIGLVRAAGLSSDALATILQNRYKQAEIYTNPTFQVIASDEAVIEERLVIVGGYVRQPGPRPYIRNMTLWQAVQAAGGATEFGSLNRVQLTRGGTSRVLDCDVPREKMTPLQPGDSIDVPQKKWTGG